MGSRVRAKAVLASVLLTGVLTAGCSTAVDPRSSAATSPTVSPGLSSPTPTPSPTFRPDEIRSIPDPRSLLSPGLRKDLRFTARGDAECHKDKANEVIDRWECYLFTPHQRPWDEDMTAIHMELHHPTWVQDATTFATAMFDRYRRQGQSQRLTAVRGAAAPSLASRLRSCSRTHPAALNAWPETTPVCA